MSSASSSPALSTPPRSSSSTTITSTFPSPSGLFSSTFVAPSPSSSDNGNAAGFNTGPSIASSASLYLYTFLATLVLLLSVSAAIILRSLILRRRHRRMVEEAIRNGTWVPPSPGAGPFGMGRANARVDLSRKPKMWEAFVGVEKGLADGMHPQRDVEWDWDSIRPFSVAYLKPPPPAAPISLAGANPSSTAATVGDGSSQARRPPFLRRLVRLLSPTPSSPTSPLPVPHASGTGSNTPIVSRSHANSTHNLSADPTRPSTPQTIRVAILIAMPSQAQSQTHSTKTASPPPASTSTPFLSLSPSPLSLSPVPAHVSPHLRPPSPSSIYLSPPSLSHTPSLSPTPSHTSSPPSPSLPGAAGGEPELPHVEFGVAELVVRAEDVDAEGIRGGGGMGGGKEGARLSVGSSVDV